MTPPVPPGQVRVVYPCQRCDAKGVIGFDDLIEAPCPRCGGTGYLTLAEHAEQLPPPALNPR